ncbi:MAG: glycoside hydrolase family 57 protein [Candidatus Altiarchaeota archaeon]
MTAVCFYFQVHQPFRTTWFWPDNGIDYKGKLEDLYFDTKLNEFTFRKVAGKCYHRANDIILSQIDRFKGGKRKFKVSFSLSGTFLDQCERWDKDLMEKFRQMADSGCVEFLGETYYHSLAGLYEDKEEFTDQVEQHRQAMKDLLGMKPEVFRNTELLYHDGIGETIERMGFKATMTEGTERILEGWKSPNYVYRRRGGDIRILLRNYKLSDDVGYRFSSKWWEEYPLTADKYSAWLSSSPGDTINIFMDYETFGEHQWEDTGIFWFLGAIPQEVLKWENLEFSTPSEVVRKHAPRGEITVPYYETVSWADIERDPSAWLGNHMQHLNFSQMKRLGKLVKESGNEEFIRIWKYLQTGDHFYYMCTKWLADGDVHKYFSHHGNPYDAGINYLAILSDLKERVLRYMLENGGKAKPRRKN